MILEKTAFPINTQGQGPLDALSLKEAEKAEAGRSMMVPVICKGKVRPERLSFVRYQ